MPITNYLTPAHDAAIWAVVGRLESEDLNDTTPRPPQTEEPIPDEPKILAIIEKLKHPESHNGYLGIARSEEVSVQLVKLVQQKADERRREIAEAAGPIEEPLGEIEKP